MATRAALLLLLCLCAVAAASSARPHAPKRTITKTSAWSVCSSKSSYSVSIKDVLISPDPCVAGDLATFTIPAYASVPLEGGTVVVTVTFHGIKIHTEKDDLCSKSNCPIQGEFTLFNSEELPAFTPPGSYKLKFQVLDKAGKELTCVQISFSIVWFSEFEQLMDATTSALHNKLE